MAFKKKINMDFKKKTQMDFKEMDFEELIFRKKL